MRHVLVIHLILQLILITSNLIRYHPALAITGTWRGTNLSTIYEELGWKSLTDRRWFRRIFYLKIILLLLT